MRSEVRNAKLCSAARATQKKKANVSKTIFRAIFSKKYSFKIIHFCIVSKRSKAPKVAKRSIEAPKVKKRINARFNDLQIGENAQKVTRRRSV